MWQPTCHCLWSGGGGGIRAITCVHLFSLTQVARLVLSDLVPFTRVIDIMKLLYLFEAEMPSESSIQSFFLTLRDVDMHCYIRHGCGRPNQGKPVVMPSRPSAPTTCQ